MADARALQVNPKTGKTVTRQMQLFDVFQIDLDSLRQECKSEGLDDITGT